MIIRERRSGIDTRSEAEKLLVGERRSGIDRRTGETAPAAPSKEQLGLFARRLRRAMRDQGSRGYFGIANGENEFSFYPDVVRVVEWIERLSTVESEQQARPTLRKAVAGTTDPFANQTSEPQTASPRPDAP
jgi:hypothetical protein